jgi:hypothetical protein
MYYSNRLTRRFNEISLAPIEALGDVTIRVGQQPAMCSSVSASLPLPAQTSDHRCLSEDIGARATSITKPFDTAPFPTVIDARTSYAGAHAHADGGLHCHMAETAETAETDDADTAARTYIKCATGNRLLCLGKAMARRAINPVRWAR